MNDAAQDFTVYCDESRHSSAACNSHMAIGGLWVPTEKKVALIKELRSLFQQVGLNAELKWSKVSRLKLEAYKAVIDAFMNHDLRFRVIVVEQSKLDYALHKEGNEELGFYTFYYEMLIKWLQQPGRYNLLLDFKKNREHGHFSVLKHCLDWRVPPGVKVTGLNSIDSADSPLAQVADILTGAVAASWCGFHRRSPKAELATHIASKTGKSSLLQISPSPALEKLNIFKIDLK